MKKNISGCCSKTDKDKVIFINTNHTIGRQNFTLAHEVYHLLYEDIDNFIVCGVNNNSQSELNADNFASTLLIPDSALYWFNKNQITEWSIEDIIKCEQYYQVSHAAMLLRLKNLNWISQDQFNEYEKGIIRQADRLGYDTSLYKPSAESQRYSSMGKLIRLTENAYENNRITGGKRKEILLKSFRKDILYSMDDRDEFE